MKNADNCNKSPTRLDSRRKLQECELVHKNIIYGLGGGSWVNSTFVYVLATPQKWRLMMNAIAAICFYYYDRQKLETGGSPANRRERRRRIHQEAAGS